MRFSIQAACFLLLAAVIPGLGCRAQVPATGALSPELSRRVELLLRSKTKIPPDYMMAIGPREPSEIAGYDKIQIVVTADGSPSRPIPFLISKDGKTLAQFNQFDLSKDPKTIVSGAGRPGRGGDTNAPVEIVVFDDLECPYCARMHAQLFPALLDRYGKEVHIVYRDYPLSQHPWAMRAAVDVNCVGTQSAPAYWNIVDYIHSHVADFGAADQTLQKATDALDKLAIDEATKDNLNAAAIDACIKKQDTAEIKASMKVGDELGVEATPVLFINGEKLEGAYPVKDVFRMVDEALTAVGKTPPAPYKEPTAPSPILPKPGD